MAQISQGESVCTVVLPFVLCAHIPIYVRIWFGSRPGGLVLRASASIRHKRSMEQPEPVDE